MKYYVFNSNALSEYLTEKSVDGKTVRTWYHRQFLVAAHEYYLSDVSHQQRMHASLAQLFLQTGGVRRTIRLQQRRGKVIEDADRRVVPQVLDVKNLRKLNALPYHLVRAQQWKTLTEECLLNFQFVFTKLQAVGITALFGEYQQLTALNELANDASLALVRDFLELNYEALRLDAHLMPYFLCESLRPYIDQPVTYTGLSKLASDSAQWLQQTDHALLLPINPINITPIDSPIKFSQLLGFAGDVSPNEQVVVCRWQKSTTKQCKIKVFDLLNRDVIATIEIGRESPVAILPDNKHFFIVVDGRLVQHELNTGDVTRRVDLLDRRYESVTARCVDVTPDGRYLVLFLKLGKPRGLTGDR